jgi:ketosteroid isomerase-like protein
LNSRGRRGNKKSRLFFCAGVLCLACVVFAETRGNILQSLIESERSFAAMSVEKGRQEAFLAYLAEDSVLFRPGPVSGRKWMREHSPSPGILDWRPELAFVSRSADLGFTTGPWEFRKKNMEEEPVACGSFASVWVKQGGTWRLLVDTGISYPEPGPAAPEVRSLSAAAATGVPPDSDGERQALMAADEQLILQIARKGAEAAYSEWLAEDGWLLREGRRPLQGRAAALPVLKGFPASTLTQVEGGVSAAADLGYTYGTAGEKGNYVRVWRKSADRKWRVVLDVLAAP